MGEAKIRRRAHAAMLAANPYCIYCGGRHPADTVEHMPPLAMFDGRYRPKGLEFPTCRECNNRTSDSDLVASLMGRMWPDAKRPNELKGLLHRVSRHVPDLLEEMEVGSAGQKLARRNIPSMPPDAAVLRTNGPILTRHMRTFGAKLGLALHFEAHRSLVPPEGGVQPMFLTNVNAARGELPMEMVKLLPSPRTLEQGVWDVSEQFQYSWLLTEEKRHSIFYAVFRSSFAIAALTALNRTEFLERNADKYPITIPGDFRRQACRPSSAGADKV